MATKKATKSVVTPKVVKTTVVTTADSLGDALAACAVAVQNAKNAAVYRCVLISVRGERMTVRGTDLSVFIERHLKVKSSGDGIWLVPFDTFNHFISHVKGRLVLIFGSSEVVASSAQKHVASTKLRKADEYMSWPKWDALKPLSVNATDMVEAFQRSLVSISDQYTDPLLTHLSVKQFNSGLADVQACNNNRYQITRIKMALKNGLLIPGKLASIIAKLEDAKAVFASDSLIGVQTAHGRIMCRLAIGDENYPKFSELLPTKFSTTASMDRREISQAVSLAKGFADSKFHRVQLSIDVPSKTLKFESSLKTDSFRALMKFKHCKGKSMSLLVDADDLEKFFGLCTSNTIVVRMSGSSGQILLQDPEQPKFWFVANPLVLGNDNADEDEAEKEPEAKKEE